MTDPLDDVQIDYPAERLARMCAKVGRMEAPIGGSGEARITITSHDLHWALNALRDPGAEEFAVYKYAGGENRGAVVDQVHERMERIAARESWGGCGGDVLRRLSELVVDEDVTPNLCPRCVGRTQYLHNHLWHVCPRCNGTGHVRVTVAAKARHVGVSANAFKKTWLRRMEIGREILSRWEAAIESALRSKLR